MTPDTTPGALTPKRLGTLMSLRLTPDLFAQVAAAAMAEGLTLSQFVRRAIEASVPQPIGWQCDHTEITGPAGTIGRVTAACGCEFRPVYDVRELRHAA